MNVTVYGVNPTDTMDLLKDRASRIKEGRELSDGRKVALIVEGGAMRGVISCASLMALEELGLTDVFDEVYGTSAGAVNAAYFLAGQAAYATTIYYQKVNNSRFIRRLWHRPMVNLDELFDSIIAGDRPLCIERVLASRSRLFITIADAANGQAFLGLAQSNETPLLTLLKASAAMPLLYNSVVKVNGRNCFDGGLINPIPIAEAIEAGCTDLVVLLTRPESFKQGCPSRIEQHFFDLSCAHGNAELMGAYCKAHLRENSTRDMAFGRRSLPDGIRIVTICPAETDPRIERMTCNTALLKAAAIASAKRTLEAFGHAVEEFVEVLRPFPAIRSKRLSRAEEFQL